jgi:hypothetical protein
MAAQIQTVNDLEEHAGTEKSPAMVEKNVQDRPVDSYRPKKWQSNVTILSCVCLYSKPTNFRSLNLLISLVYRKF